MTSSMTTIVSEKDLADLIANQVEEDLHLEYKGADSLLKIDIKKKEISKDVSSFANSDGGQIIYGIREFNEPDKNHLPERVDPISRTEISKEWLEQVINSNIQPKIMGLLITPIQLSSSIDHVAYIVTIPQAKTAHQASDKRYYKRYNFMSVAMEDYEVKDVINRQMNPILKVEVEPSSTIFYDDLLSIPFFLSNSSIKMAKDIKLTVQINEPEDCRIESLQNLEDLSGLNPGKLVLGSKEDFSVYKGLALRVGKANLRVLKNPTILTFTTTIYGDNMEPVISTFRIEIANNQFTYI